MRYLARICFNNRGWERPAGIAPKIEGPTSFVRKFGFGHEEWLFRSGREINGWRYGFLQPVNKASRRRLQDPFDVLLFTIDESGLRHLVATITDVRHLTPDEAEQALKIYRSKGWLAEMRREVKAVKGKVRMLGSGEYAPHILNVRFRPQAIERVDQPISARRRDFVRRFRRYQLYDLPLGDLLKVERGLRVRRRAHRGPLLPLKIFRKETPASEYSVQHRNMQQRLVGDLVREHGEDRVEAEFAYVDVTVTLPNQVILYEIKSDPDPRAVLRYALGQLMEYAFFRKENARRRLRLVAVGQNEMRAPDRAYLQILQKQFRIPLDYLVVKP